MAAAARFVRARWPRKADVYAIVGARVVTVSGAVLESATLVMRDGVIEAVGAGCVAARTRASSTARA